MFMPTASMVQCMHAWPVRSKVCPVLPWGNLGVKFKVALCSAPDMVGALHTHHLKTTCERAIGQGQVC